MLSIGPPMPYCLYFVIIALVLWCTAGHVSSTKRRQRIAAPQLQQWENVGWTKGVRHANIYSPINYLHLDAAEY